ncbi:MAG: metallophosphoesterase [Nanoarchaeota archaeon]|nr:metallophosphoesterase [Nanoarchaeota archaeon]
MASMKGFSIGFMIFFALFLAACETQDHHLFDNPKTNFTFIVVGDTQPPTTEEQLMLISKIYSERPDFVIHVGDFVDIGTEEEWKRVDNTFGQLMQAGIPVYPVMGNHEYADAGGSLSETKEKIQMFSDRFPHLNGNRWYSFRYGNLTFIMLDSTHMHLLDDGQRQSDAQTKWFRKMVKGQGLKIVTLHHPMVSHYGAGAELPEVEMRKILKDAVIRYSSPAVVFSGHVHNFQAINDGSMYFIVTGGGAGGKDGKGTTLIHNSLDGYRFDFFFYTHYVKTVVTENDVIMQAIFFHKEIGQWVEGKKVAMVNLTTIPDGYFTVMD